ncbi:MAG: hypothetical protein EVA26_02780 [Burkholderiaceae bacterium]|nr:MAG: hypothetical protein EVA26_02780 [Burkholderiaceae bacterium]
MKEIFMIVGIFRLILLSALLFNTCYMVVLDQKITNVGYKLNINIHDINFLDSFKRIANDLDEQIENHRNKFRESLVKKGIDERNNILIKSDGELIKELE